MKTYLLILIFALNTFQLFSQESTLTSKDLIGIWQADSKNVDRFWNDSYAFFKDGTFGFLPSQFDGLQRIIGINGQYEVKDNQLILTVKSTHEKVGGKLVRSKYTTKSDSWQVIDFETKELNIKAEPAILLLEKCEGDSTSVKCILIDKRKYYKQIDDPEDIY
ncbi:hypothetical protein INQ51_05830 [Maribellus sp. CM-23]|uniref:hypothetical protein n=1 Tax=Maribellus sp. CM-23 TaxID=2781026 RepID=UPI001F36AEF1|nr:hypothetical protein [Maribellus sp. CM-23]MCE4563823.1 hypothetical protein [Maribellus sp. CM-23]